MRRVCPSLAIAAACIVAAATIGLFALSIIRARPPVLATGLEKTTNTAQSPHVSTGPTKSTLLRTTDANRVIGIRRILPVSEPGATASALPHQQVEFAWELTNLGGKPYAGVRLDANCGCQVVDLKPVFLDVGESVIVRAKIWAPAAGENIGRINVVALGAENGLAHLDYRLAADIRAPAFLDVPKGIVLSGVVGETVDYEFALTTLEKPGAPNLLAKVELTPATTAAQGLLLEVERVDTSITTDPELVRRRYAIRIHASAPFRAPAREQLMIAAATRPPSIGEKALIPVTLDVKPALVILPNSLEFEWDADGEPTPKRVVVIDRRATSNGGVEIAECDTGFVVVRPESELAALRRAFWISPARRSTDWTSNVVFQSGSELAVLTIRCAATSTAEDDIQ